MMKMNNDAKESFLSLEYNVWNYVETHLEVAYRRGKYTSGGSCYYEKSAFKK